MAIETADTPSPQKTPLQKSKIYEGQVTREELEYYLGFLCYLDQDNPEHLVTLPTETLANLAHIILYKFESLKVKSFMVYKQWTRAGFATADEYGPASGFSGKHGMGNAGKMLLKDKGRLGPSTLTSADPQYLSRQASKKEEYIKSFCKAYDAWIRDLDVLKKTFSPLKNKAMAMYGTTLHAEEEDGGNNDGEEDPHGYDSFTLSEKLAMVEDAMTKFREVYDHSLDFILEHLPGRPFLNLYSSGY